MSTKSPSRSHRRASPDRTDHPRRWTREEYYRAGDLGLFGPEERLELLDGEIITKVTPKTPHVYGVQATANALSVAFGPGHHARSQMPLILNDESEPLPDVAVVPGTLADYLPSHPRPADTRLVVEVSDTTLGFDRGRKRTAYARAGVQEYWILNLLDRQLEVYRHPSGARYRQSAIYREGDSVSPIAAPDAVIPVADLLPPATAADA
jgi:Uma2 family endonuclease